MQSTGEAVEAGGADAFIIQMLPLTVLSLLYAVIVFIIARKRGVNPWPWAVGTVVPFIGAIIVGPLFMLLSFLSVFDRLNALEGRGRAT